MGRRDVTAPCERPAAGQTPRDQPRSSTVVDAEQSD